MDEVLCIQIIESLRKGIPPQRGIDLYSVGNEKLIEGVKRHHLNQIEAMGIIRFISGSWGAGKTHLFRLLREVAFQNNCLVSNVELNVNDVPFNKFEEVFYAIVRNIATPSFFKKGALAAAPFGWVVQESLSYLGTGNRSVSHVSYEDYTKACESLMSDQSIDIDFKKMIQKYWETFLPEAADKTVQGQTRAEILQWFSGKGTVGQYRRRFGVNTMVSRSNAKLMLQSLSGFIRLSGYRGLLILFDEAEQSYSNMRNAQLRGAHNNLLALINGIDDPLSRGLFLIYATTPDFYTDSRHGIIINGALSGRIGQPNQRKPRALDIAWNFDEVDTDLSVYQVAAKKIQDIYVAAYPEAGSGLPSEKQLGDFVRELYTIHPSLSALRFWRVMVTSLITHFDDFLEGEIRPTQELYDDVMDRLREA